jgi:hypothetical protein
MHQKQPKAGWLTLLLICGFSTAAFALDSALIEIRRKPTDTSINGIYFYSYNVSGKAFRSDVLQFGPQGGVFYNEVPARALQVFFEPKSAMFYVVSNGTPRWIQVDAKGEFAERDKIFLRDLGHLLIERFSKDEDAVRALQVNFGIAETDADPVKGDLILGDINSLGALDKLAVPGDADSKIPVGTRSDMLDFVTNPAGWQIAENGVCTDNGCVYVCKERKTRRFLVTHRLKVLVDYATAKPEEDPTLVIPELGTQAEVESYFAQARDNGADYLIINIGNLTACDPCKKLHGNLKRLLRLRKNVEIVHIPKHKHPEMATYFGYDGNGIPWTLVFDLRKDNVAPKFGLETHKVRGLKSEAELQALVPASTTTR